jgi:hypothetical protein
MRTLPILALTAALRGTPNATVFNDLVGLRGVQ